MFKQEFLQRVAQNKHVVLQGFAQDSKCVEACIFVEICLGYQM